MKYYPNQLRKVCSVIRCLKIEEGSLKDYKRLAAFHYRNPDTHPVPLKIFVLRRGDGESVGVVFYSWPPLNTSGRKKALGYRVLAKELNRQFATIARVILHPKYRSVGLGVKLVKETLPLVGRQYVETMAVMAKYNPFFEKAGMRRITMRKPPKSVCQVVDKLEELGFRPYLLASYESNLQHLKSMTKRDLDKVKGILGEAGYFKRLQSSGKAYVRKQDFRKWLGDKPIEIVAKVISRLAVLAKTKVYLFWEKG